MREVMYDAQITGLKAWCAPDLRGNWVCKDMRLVWCSSSFAELWWGRIFIYEVGKALGESKCQR